MHMIFVHDKIVHTVKLQGCSYFTYFIDFNVVLFRLLKLVAYWDE